MALITSTLTEDPGVVPFTAPPPMLILPPVVFTFPPLVSKFPPPIKFISVPVPTFKDPVTSNDVPVNLATSTLLYAISNGCVLTVPNTPRVN